MVNELKKVDCNNINKEDAWIEEKKKTISSDKRRIPFDIEHSYLYLSYQTFYFRFHWPPDVRGVIGQNE